MVAGRYITILYDYGMEEQVLETGGEAEWDEHQDSSVDKEKPTANRVTGYFSIWFIYPHSLEEDI